MHLNKKFTIKRLRTWLKEFNDIKHNHSYKKIKIFSSDYDARKVIFFWLWCNTPSVLGFDNKPSNYRSHYCFGACANMKMGTDPRLNRSEFRSELELFWKYRTSGSGFDFSIFLFIQVCIFYGFFWKTSFFCHWAFCVLYLLSVEFDISLTLWCAVTEKINFFVHKIFFDAASFCFCLYEILFDAISTRFCRHQITFCATPNFLFQHKIIFRVTANFCFGHHLECYAMVIYFYCHIATKI